MLSSNTHQAQLQNLMQISIKFPNFQLKLLYFLHISLSLHSTNSTKKLLPKLFFKKHFPVSLTSWRPNYLSPSHKKIIPNSLRKDSMREKNENVSCLSFKSKRLSHVSMAKYLMYNIQLTKIWYLTQIMC